jgi:hypothetical protein
MSNRWDARQRASRYKDHVIGQGWQEPFAQVVRDSQTGEERIEKKYRPVPGFKRETAPSSIKVDDVENAEWPVEFAPQYENKSWRTRLAKWKSPATPMISNIKANPKRGIMLVTFGSDGAQVTYDHVPREVIAELQHIAASGGSLGRLFWDLVRYRGSAGGSKYPFWYAKAGGMQMSDEGRVEAKRMAEKALDWVSDPEHGENTMTIEDADKYIQGMIDAYDNDNFAKMTSLYLDGKRRGFYP